MIMDKPYEQAETGCCPRFNPEPWQDQEITWQDKLFVKDKIMSVFHIPLNFGKVVVRNVEKIKNADAFPAEAIMLSDEKSLFGSDIYIAVAKEVTGAEMTRISGTFLTKVFEGPYKNMKKWIDDMNEFVKSRGKEVKKMYFFYTTCPSCAKFYGKDYTVILAQV